MEGAAYSLQVHPDTMMRLYLDKLIAIMAGAQWEDGYLYTFYSVPQKQPEKRWTNEKDMHEQYCMGHMLEAAVAHYQVTGNKAFLNIATSCADYLCQTFGPGRRTDPPGHQEIEIGLCRLYRVTGDGKYLDTGQVPAGPARPHGQPRTQRRRQALRRVRPGSHPGHRADPGRGALRPGDVHVHRHGGCRGPDRQHGVHQGHRRHLERCRRHEALRHRRHRGLRRQRGLQRARTNCPT